MNRKPELALLYRIAQRYYIDKLPQSQIAEMENISRSQISRLLDKAEQMGIVSIRVQLPEQPDLQALGAAICSGLKLKEVLVASLDKDTSDGTPDKEAIAAHAAPYLSSVFRNAKTVGIGWGRTMYETSLLLPYRRASHDTLFVPLIGISGVNEPCLQINTIVDRMAEKHRAGSYFVSLPAFRDRTLPLSDIEEQRLKKLEEYWHKLDVAVFGLGSAPSEGPLFITEVNETYSKELCSSGVVGDILSQFFMADGSVPKFNSAYRQLAIDIGWLKNISKTICLAGGKDKAKAIMAAARCGYFNTLITDSITAKAIYDTLRKEGAI